MKLRAKIVLGVLGVVGIGALGFVGTVYARWDRQWEAPMPDIHASDDPAVVERGRQFVWGPAHCGSCHGAIEQLPHHEATNEPIPLTGGFEFPLPFGTFVAPNITPDEATGIGSMTDGEIARALRHGVGRDGTMLMPIMPFANLSDADLTAIVSYLRSIDPVEQERPANELAFVGKALFAFVLEPQGPNGTPPAEVEEAPTAEYGEYIAYSVANCDGCHTERDLMTLEVIGEPFSGGLELPHHGKTFVIPNITPGGKGSRITGWDLDGFKARIRTGQPTVTGSPMPWASYAGMSDVQLEALWAYLQTVEPVDVDRGPAVLSD